MDKNLNKLLLELKNYGCIDAELNIDGVMHKFTQEDFKKIEENKKSTVESETVK